MCGIFGIAGTHTTTANDDKFLKTCAIAGSVRGLDATGMIFSHNRTAKELEAGKTPVNYIKKSITGAEFVQSVFDPTYNMDPSCHSVVGHNRAATIGSINDDTAHPFKEGRVIGVHNGTLRGDWRGALGVSKKCDVDSRGLFRAISAKGIDWVIKNMEGAAAIVWVDLQTNRTFLYRNMERPLHYATGFNKVWYASEKPMLEWVLQRSGITGKTVVSFKPYVLYEITDGKVEELRELDRPAYKAANTGNQQWGRATTASASTPTNKQTSKTGGTTTPISKPHVRLPSPSTGILWDKGVPYRGYAVPQSDRKNGIYGEWVERGYSTYPCECCDKPIIQEAFLEETRNQGSVKLHEYCLSVYRSLISSTEPLHRIKRKPIKVLSA